MSAAGVWLQHCLPHRLLARIVYRASHSRRSWIRKPLIRLFSAHYAIDLTEAETGNPDEFPSFNDFFTRTLKPDARPIEGDEQTVVSPVDGRLTEFGKLRAGSLIQAKGLEYRLTELVGEAPVPIQPFENGAFATIYLAPHDYHRVHMPFTGRLLATRYIPGRRFSVNEATSRGIRNLFCRNERAICWFQTNQGTMALVFVGALNVSSITLANRGEIPSGTPLYWLEDTPLTYARGEEIGRFNLGSTVIALFPEDEIAWNDSLISGQLLKLGQTIGRQTKGHDRRPSE